MRIGRNLRKWLDARRTITELDRLSNETLSDIGITRYDIHHFSNRKSF